MKSTQLSKILKIKSLNSSLFIHNIKVIQNGKR